ncbi:MAG: GIY-YIG nuclease family protein [Candidatus Latescibacterota bacterium]
MYMQDGHGGNVGLKSRDPSDYQVSILEVAGSSATEKDILRMEGLWQSKLQSYEMGLNRRFDKLSDRGPLSSIWPR